MPIPQVKNIGRRGFGNMSETEVTNEVTPVESEASGEVPREETIVKVVKKKEIPKASVYNMPEEEQEQDLPEVDNYLPPDDYTYSSPPTQNMSQTKTIPPKKEKKVAKPYFKLFKDPVIVKEEEKDEEEEEESNMMMWIGGGILGLFGLSQMMKSSPQSQSLF